MAWWWWPPFPLLKQTNHPTPWCSSDMWRGEGPQDWHHWLRWSGHQCWAAHNELLPLMGLDWQSPQLEAWIPSQTQQSRHQGSRPSLWAPRPEKQSPQWQLVHSQWLRLNTQFMRQHTSIKPKSCYLYEWNNLPWKILWSPFQWNRHCTWWSASSIHHWSSQTISQIFILVSSQMSI